MAGILVFAVSYAFYIFTYIKSGAQIVYPLYLAPAVVIAYAAALSFMLARVTGLRFMGRFLKLSNTMSVFILLLAVQFFIRLNLPDPHNFLQRKLELLLGAAYSVYLFTASGYFLYITARAPEIKKATARAAFVIILMFSFIFNFALSLWFNYANEPTGDEPVYLLTAHSLIHDRDIDLKNNYENKDYEIFHSRKLEPQGENAGTQEKIISKHPYSFSALIAPFYLIAGRAGVSSFMCLLCALLAAVLFYICYRMNGDILASAMAALISSFTLPLLQLVNLASTEIPCALVLASSYALYKYKPEKTVFFSVVMALAIWMHIRIAPVYGGLALLYLIKNREKIPQVIAFIAIQLLSFAAFFSFNYLVYGEIIPYFSHQAGLIKSGSYFVRGLFVYFFDRQLGLFSYAPFYIAFIPGLYLIYKRARQTAAEFALLIVPYYFLIASYAEWGWGSASPRYLSVVIFIFTAAVAETVSALKNTRSAGIFTVLAAASVMLSAVVAAVPWFRWDRAGHENWLIFMLYKFTGIDLNIIFPSIINMERWTAASLALWTAVTAGIALFFIFKFRRGIEKKDQVRR